MKNIVDFWNLVLIFVTIAKDGCALIDNLHDGEEKKPEIIIAKQ